MESGEVKAEQRQRQRQQPVLLPKKSRRTKPETSANGGSASSGAGSSSLTRTSSSPASGGGGSSSLAAGSSSLSRTSSSSPPSGDADGKGQQHQHEQGGGGKRPRLVWTTELHDLFVKAYDSLGDDAVPRRILEKMNEKMNVPEISREKVASHLQKHKLHLRRLAEEASGRHSPTKEAPAASHHPLIRSLVTSPTPLAEVPFPAAQLELVQQVLEEPPNCLSRSGSSIAANLQIVQSTIQHQQLCGPPIKEGRTQSAQTMQRAPADSGSYPVGMETASTAAILVPEANAAEAVIRMVQAANAENVAEAEEAAPAPGCILEQFWASPDNEAAAPTTSSWDIFVLPRGT